MLPILCQSFEMIPQVLGVGFARGKNGDPVNWTYLL